MRRWVRDLDRLLRGELTRISAIRTGTLQISAFGMFVLVVVLGGVYGFCMGWFALFNHAVPGYEQLLASTIKVPLLFLLTLLITFPSLYVFNALVGSRLTFISVLRLLIASLAINLAVLASFGPIVSFFSITTDSYPFMKLLNVVLFAISGILGLLFLLQTLHRLSLIEAEMAVEAAAPGIPPDPEGALDRTEGRILGPHVKNVFRFWVVVFALVGAQMGWVLRPFIGSPAQKFTWLRPRGSNFFLAVWQSFIDAFGMELR